MLSKTQKQELSNYGLSLATISKEYYLQKSKALVRGYKIINLDKFQDMYISMLEKLNSKELELFKSGKLLLVSTNYKEFHFSETGMKAYDDIRADEIKKQGFYTCKCCNARKILNSTLWIQNKNLKVGFELGLCRACSNNRKEENGGLDEIMERIASRVEKVSPTLLSNRAFF